MAAPTVTYTFTNGTVASGPNVSTNFSDIIAALTDGTKSFSIDALTCAGTTTLNGAVALGNATGDDITITGYVASHVIPKTTNTYDLGSTSLRYKDGWFAGNADITGTLNVAGGVVFNEGSADVDFRVESNGKANMLFVDGGNDRVGIGTASPSYTLHSVGSCYLDNRLTTGYSSPSNATLGVFGAVNDDSVNSGGVYNIEWKMSGNASGQFWYANYLTRDGTRTLGAYCTGTAWTNASDVINKKEIDNIDYGINTVMASRPVKFKWKQSNQPDIGFIAQEMELIAPEVVSGQDGAKGISYGALVAVAFKAIQELSAKNDLLEARLETEVSALMARVAALEAK